MDVSLANIATLMSFLVYVPLVVLVALYVIMRNFHVLPAGGTFRSMGERFLEYVGNVGTSDSSGRGKGHPQKAHGNRDK